MINNSFIKCCICNNKKCGKFTIINNKKYHLNCIEDLHQRIDKAIFFINTTFDNYLVDDYIKNNLLEILKGDVSNE